MSATAAYATLWGESEQWMIEERARRPNLRNDRWSTLGTGHWDKMEGSVNQDGGGQGNKLCGASCCVDPALLCKLRMESRSFPCPNDPALTLTCLGYHDNMPVPRVVRLVGVKQNSKTCTCLERLGQTGVTVGMRMNSLWVANGGPSGN